MKAECIYSTKIELTRANFVKKLQTAFSLITCLFPLFPLHLNAVKLHLFLFLEMLALSVEVLHHLAFYLFLSDLFVEVTFLLHFLSRKKEAA